mgnify:CR=1 FL=1
MTDANSLRIGILYPGNEEVRRNATPENNRFSPLFQALVGLGAQIELAVYHDDFCAEVRSQLLGLDGVLVWVNPIEGGRDRTILDAMLGEVATAGVFVSTHPDIILKMGTKEVLYQTRTLGWGCDTRLYASLDGMRETLPVLLAQSQARVLKQYRGHSGIGVWKVEALPGAGDSPPQLETPVRVRHAQRGSTEETIPLGEFFARCAAYFTNAGKMIDQPYQSRLDEGMFRCYLVHDRVAGFGHQPINALYPAAAGQPPSEAPQPGPRLYYPPTMPDAQLLKRKVEEEWLPAMQQLLEIETAHLPVLWDADFLLGPKTTTGEDTYVLCEINVSSVAPFPDSAIPLVANAVVLRARAAKRGRD